VDKVEERSYELPETAFYHEVNRLYTHGSVLTSLVIFCMIYGQLLLKPWQFWCRVKGGFPCAKEFVPIFDLAAPVT